MSLPRLVLKSIEKTSEFLLFVTFFIAGALLALGTYHFLDLPGEADRASGEADIAEINPGNDYRKLPEPEEIIMKDTPFETELYINRGSQPGPEVLIVGGVHGDEPSGYHAAREIIYWEVEKGALMILPEANPPAIEAKERFVDGKRDLNRAFRNIDEGDLTGKAAVAINEVLEEYRPDWILDLHSARGFNREDEDKLGQTLIFSGDDAARSRVERLKENINRWIDEPKHRYNILEPAVRGSLVRESYLRYGINGFIVESSRELSLYSKKKYHLRVVRNFLGNMELK